MNSKSIKVPQPQFCNWVVKRRQELNLSRADLKEKIGNQISDRTLIYLEDENRNSFSEFTLTLLAKGLDLSYLELLEKINDLGTVKNKPSSFSEKNQTFGFFLQLLYLFQSFFFSFLI